MLLFMQGEKAQRVGGKACRKREKGVGLERRMRVGSESKNESENEKKT